MKKIQEYTLLILIIIQLVMAYLLIFGNPDYNPMRAFGITLFALDILFLIALVRKKFIDFTFFFLALGGVSLALVLFFDNNGEKSPLLFVPAVFIFFILWKDNFFTKEPIKKSQEETIEKGKSMLNELKEMEPDEIKVGKTVIKKASVKREENKNSTEK